MGIDVTNEDKCHLTIKSVHITVGREDWQGWPTITVADHLGYSQFYAPSLTLMENEERDAKYKSAIKEMEIALDAARSCHIRLFETDKRLKDVEKKATECEQRLVCAQKASIVFIAERDKANARCAQLEKIVEEQKQTITDSQQKYALLMLRMKDEVQIASNRARRSATKKKKAS